MTLHVKVLGGGCENCHNLDKNTRQAGAQLGIDATYELITDRSQFARYGILATPALVIDEKLVSAGRVLPPGEIMTLLATAADAGA